MELKVACDCGQKYKFDVQPVSDQMPFPVSCPVCGADGTPIANAQLSQLASVPIASPVSVALAPPVIPTPRPIPAAPLPAYAPSRRARTAPSAEYNLGRGILGAAIGAALAAGLMYGFFLLVGFRFPLLGVGIGGLTGYLARLMARGTDSTLGAIAAVLAVAATTGSLFLIYGEFPIICIISVIVSASFAYRTAS